MLTLDMPDTVWIVPGDLCKSQGGTLYRVEAARVVRRREPVRGWTRYRLTCSTIGKGGFASPIAERVARQSGRSIHPFVWHDRGKR